MNAASFERRRLAARLGATVDEASDGDELDARLLRAARERGLAVDDLFGARAPGPRARAVPVDLPEGHPLAAALRFPRGPARAAPRPGPARAWSNADLALPADATVRIFAALPDGRIAVGSDMGASIGGPAGFEAFPWPGGSRRSRVEAMTVADGVLTLATTEAVFELPVGGVVKSRRLPPDDDDGRDDVRAMLGVGTRRYVGWRCRFEGGVGPPEALALAAGAGQIWAGTRDGELHVVDGGGPIRTFGEPKRRPVRHLAFARGALWVAADGALHRFDGASWSRAGTEPTALHTDTDDNLWLVRDGAVWLASDDAMTAFPADVTRPWCLLVHAGSLWIGHPGGLTQVPLLRADRRATTS